MNIIKTVNDNSANLKIEGRLDTTTAPELEACVNELTQSAGSLTVDCEGLEYISSAGLRVILKAQKAMSAKGGMKLIHVNEAIMEVFDITGFTDILTIE